MYHFQKMININMVNNKFVVKSQLFDFFLKNDEF